MTFNDINEIKKAGFSGFKTMKELFENSSEIPKIKGVYLVMNLEQNPPVFLQIGSGGYFKGTNPNVAINILKSNWVENTNVVYIGKAGKEGSKATLQSRLRQYFGFGKGGNVGHKGGRLIWQLENSKDLIVCWKTLPNDDPRTIEAELIQQFTAKFKKGPFANLAD